MKVVFADTFYWVALLHIHDNWHRKVNEFSRTLKKTKVVTTEEVLSEVLTTFSGYGAEWRERAVRLVEEIFDDPNVEVIEQSHDSFIDGLALYKKRLDKGFSLQDCISMQTMRELGVSKVLTHDKHFTQEGFIVLFKD